MEVFASISVVTPPSKKMRVRDDALLRALTAASKKKPKAKVILFVVLLFKINCRSLSRHRPHLKKSECSPPPGKMRCLKGVRGDSEQIHSTVYVNR